MLEAFGTDLLEEIRDGTWIGWLLMVGVAIIGTLLIKAVLKFVESRVRRISTRIKGVLDNILVEWIATTKSWTIFIWILNGLVQSSDAEDPAKKAIFIAFVILSALQISIWGLHAIAIWRDDYLKKKIGKDASSASAIGIMTTAIQGLFLVALILMGLSNLGVDIAALIAGLGVGGIAVALAAQNILGDLFGSLSIVLDKPFVIGDFIVAGNDMGTVEHIGVKTTRLRSLSGEELIFSNKDLLESRVKNFKRMYERRAVLNFDVSYSTPLEKLKQIPQWVSDFVNQENLLRLERCHLANFDVSSLKYELAYWVKDPDYNKYMDHQQALIHKILERFEQEEITFALAAQNVYLQNLPKWIEERKEEEEEQKEARSEHSDSEGPSH